MPLWTNQGDDPLTLLVGAAHGSWAWAVVGAACLGQLSQPGGLAPGSACVLGLGLCGERTPTLTASQRPWQDSGFSSQPRNRHPRTPERARLPCNP